MPFNNPIVGGNQLVRSAIQSQNFVTAISGWQITRDGTAQFSNAVIRGEVDVGPASPNPRITIGPVPATLAAATTDFTWTSAIVFWFDATSYAFEAIGIFNLLTQPITATGTYSVATGVLFNSFETTNPAGTLLYGSSTYNSQLLSWSYRHGVMEFTSDASITLDTGGIQLDAGIWTAYTPTWTAAPGPNPAIGNGSISGSYQYLNKHTVVAKIRIVQGTTTTRGTGAYSFSLPVTAASVGDTGVWWANDSGVAIRVGSLIIGTANTVQLFINGAGAAVGNATFTGTINGSIIQLTFTYEV